MDWLNEFKWRMEQIQARTEPVPPAPSSFPNLVTPVGDAKPSMQQGVSFISANFSPINDQSGHISKTSTLPPLSSCTEQIVSRALAPSYGRMVPSKAPPLGWFPSDKANYRVMPTSTRDARGVNSGQSYTTSYACQAPSFSKADLKSTLSTNLAPKSGVLASQNPTSTEISSYDDSETDSNPEFRNLTPVRRPSMASGGEDTITASGPDLIITRMDVATMNDTNFQSAVNYTPVPAPTALGRPPSSARKVHQYVLPDGTVISSGKGLGRGRPGIKRGPRKSKLSTEVNAEQPELSMPPPTPTAVTPAPSTKRKRADSSGESIVKTQTSRSTSSTPEYTPQSTQTRSGRQTQKPTTFVPPISPVPDNFAPTANPSTPVPLVAKKGRLDSSTPKSTTQHARAPLMHPKIKRRVYRGNAREQMALCEHCLRGNGPVGNAIVFCDACNKCWHQRCHEPSIPKEIVNDKNSEWICKGCDAILNGKKKGKQAKRSFSATSTAVANRDASARGAFNTPSIPIGLIAGSALTREQRVAFLSKLSKDRLVDLVLRASDLAPSLQLFEDPNPAPPPQIHTPHGNGPAELDEDEGFESGEEVYDGHAALYPKPGHGVKLPPDSVDLGMLLEGPECKTFSHWVAPPAGRLAGAALLGGVQLPHAVSNGGP